MGHTQTGSLTLDFAHRAFSKVELNELVHDLNLSDEADELFSSHLSGKDLLAEYVRITSFRQRHEELVMFFYFEKITWYTALMSVAFFPHLGCHDMNQTIGAFLYESFLAYEQWTQVTK